MKPKNCSFECLISHCQIEGPILFEKLFGPNAPLDVEIGSGMGEFLIKRAIDFPDRNIIGIEQIWERVVKTLSSISRTEASLATTEKIKNIKILKLDAYMAFKMLFLEKTIENVFCLFPCPWPKKSHIKNRLFSRDFLLLVNKCLKKKGGLKIVTDFYPYFNWVLKEAEGTGFTVSSEKINPRYNTKFEKKWMKEGQREFFEINMIKKKDVLVKKQKEILLKSYKIKKFNPKDFLWKDLKGDISVILKELIFDPEKKKCMIRLVVSEQNIIQHFWVVIFKKGDLWKIKKAEGQSFFPTPGIAKALDMIYEKAVRITSN